MCVSGWKYVRPYRLASADEPAAGSSYSLKINAKRKIGKKKMQKNWLRKERKQGGRAGEPKMSTLIHLRLYVFTPLVKKTFSMKVYL